MNYTLNVKAVNRYKVKPDMGREFKELDFGLTPQKLQEEYMDVYEGIQSDIVRSNRFDKNSDISTTYLGKVESKGSQDKLKAEESLPISESGYTLSRLLDGTKCQLLLDTGASKSFMSKSFYMQCKSLHTLPKFASTTQRIPSWKWSMCQRIIYNTSYCRHTWTQILKFILWYLKSMRMWT